MHLLETRLIHIPGYEQGCIYARSLKNRGGVAIFVKSGLAFKEMDVSKYILEVDCEVAAVKIQELNILY